MAKKDVCDAGLIPHPGSVLKMELKARKLSQKRFAAMIAMQESHLSEILSGKRDISDTLSEKLGSILKIPADHWRHMQAEYEFRNKAASLRDVAEHKAEQTLSEYDKIYDVRTIIKYVGLSEVMPTERVSFFTESLHFGAPAAQMRLIKGRYHRSEKTGLDVRMIATWSVLAEYETSRLPMPMGTFDKGQMDKLSLKLSQIFNENRNTMNKVERTLSEYGIRFCVVPRVERASIDGYSFYCDGVPSIVITRRFNRIDNVAFAVLHEVGHLKMHLDDGDVGKINLVYPEEELLTKEELEANAFASDALIPSVIWEKQPEVRPNPHEIQIKYTKWAKELNLNKWIVLGRVSHETNIYTFKSDSSREIN